MKLLVDTDAFCKLGIADLLTQTAAVFDAELGECGRLPALPSMLRRGSLLKHYGEPACTTLLPVALQLADIGIVDSHWIDDLAPIDSIDPGEALLFATSVEHGVPLVTGDKRSLRALKAVAELCGELAGRIVTLEAALLELCERIGPEQVRTRMAAAAPYDQVFRACSSAGGDPRDGLASYYRSLVAEVDPLVLWVPSAKVDK